MAISYKDIRNERQWRASTGLTENQFSKLSKLFGKTYEDFHGNTLLEQNQFRGDDILFETYKDLLFFILYSLKSDSTYDILALCFNIARSTAFEQQAANVRILNMTLQQNGDLPRRKFEDFADIQSYLDKYDELLIDATEQRRQRPVNQEVQKKNYSGKKKPIQ